MRHLSLSKALTPSSRTIFISPLPPFKKWINPFSIHNKKDDKRMLSHLISYQVHSVRRDVPWISKWCDVDQPTTIDYYDRWLMDDAMKQKGHFVLLTGFRLSTGLSCTENFFVFIFLRLLITFCSLVFTHPHTITKHTRYCVVTLLIKSYILLIISW